MYASRLRAIDESKEGIHEEKHSLFSGLPHLHLRSRAIPPQRATSLIKTRQIDCNISLTAPKVKALILEATPRLPYRPTAPPAQNSCAGVTSSRSPACRALPSPRPGTARTGVAAAPPPPTRAARLRTPPGAWRTLEPRS
ncbi:unnamed protein product, partial [Ectocarpus sp. 12 AP-2014]